MIENILYCLKYIKKILFLYKIVIYRNYIIFWEISKYLIFLADQPFIYLYMSVYFLTPGNTSYKHLLQLMMSLSVCNDE